MKKLLIASLVSASMIPAIAQADTKNFEGLSAGLNLNLISGGVKLSVGNVSLDSLGGKQTQSIAVDAAYGFAMGGKGVLTIGIDADLSDAKIASFSDPDENVTGDFSVKQKSRYGIYIAPGVAVTKDTLVYGKVGYNRMKGEISDADTSASLNFNGVSYGVGTKIMISKDAFFRIEVSRYTFSSKADPDVPALSYKPAATVGTIGLGMNF